jgi:hypothetical protein
VRALGPRLGPEQAQAALGPVLDAIRATTDPNALWALAQVVWTLAARLGSKAKAGILDVARAGLGTARTHSESVAWIGAFATALPAGLEPVACVEAIVGVLKFPTTALERSHFRDEPVADPAAPLLRRAREVCPGAEGAPAGGFGEFVAWVGQTHPAIDLTAPPVRPLPLAEAIAEFQKKHSG